ncbi:MAG: YitT family protein [Ignavibacterium sp.]|nr:YitT family protein [Ignavibacterium sp.]MDW8375008.1 YitT family protein [Ignavibacteriales bacterium]
MFENSRYQAIIDYFFITLGAILMAIGIGVFLVDAKVVPGGVSGLSMAIHYLSGNAIPVGVLIWVLNIPLYLWGIKELGKEFGIKTFYGFTSSAFFIDFFRGETPLIGGFQLHKSQTVLDLYKNDFMFLILLGATFLGVGLGLIFKFKGTTAGSDIVAAILNKRYGIKPGMAIILIDFFVILFAGFIIDIKNLADNRPALVLTFYALFLLFISGKIVDVIIDGFDYARSVHIVSDKNKEIANAIIHQLKRGATAVKSRGLYTGIEREVVVTVVTIKELVKLIELIKSIDPKAFVTINNVHEVMGEGFRRRV